MRILLPSPRCGRCRPARRELLFSWVVTPRRWHRSGPPWMCLRRGGDSPGRALHPGMSPLGAGGMPWHRAPWGTGVRRGTESTAPLPTAPSPPHGRVGDLPRHVNPVLPKQPLPLRSHQVPIAGSNPDRAPRSERCGLNCASRVDVLPVRVRRYRYVFKQASTAGKCR